MRYALCFQLTLVTPRRAPLLFKKETGKFSLLNGVSYKRRVIDKLRAENVRKMPVYQKIRMRCGIILLVRCEGIIFLFH